MKYDSNLPSWFDRTTTMTSSIKVMTASQTRRRLQKQQQSPAPPCITV